MDLKQTQPAGHAPNASFAAAFLALCLVLSLVFYQSFVPGYTVASNDGPLGTLVSQSHRLPETFTGGWQDLNTIGFRESGATSSLTYLLLLVLGPVAFSKFYPALALLVLGLGAWSFFRQLRLTSVACGLGAIAAALNSGFFSAACWGVAAHAITIGMALFGMAALADNSSSRRWLRVALAGLAVGMAVTEGADIGALFSMFIAIYVIYQAWTTYGLSGKTLAIGVVRVGLVAVFAGFIAAQVVSVLVATQIQGVSGTQQDAGTKEQRWDWATQWSLPKREALGIIIPGLFGYRMDTPKDMSAFKSAYEGGVYWGAAGRDPAWDRYFKAIESGQNVPQPGGFLRYTGGGNYAGVLVVLVALWAAFQSLRKKDSVFPLATRRWIWFWMTVCIVSLLLAFGRFAPFYQILYALPYFSTIRNPAKFTHFVNWSLVILFAYGVHGLWQTYMRPLALAEKAPAGLKRWWQTVTGFDRRWTLGSLAAFGVALLALLIYGTSRDKLEAYLTHVGFDAPTAAAISGFSIGQLAWFVGFLAVAVSLVVLVLSGGFRGPRAKWGALFLGLFLVVDLGRANLPWVIIWDYEQKYASNPVLDLLRQKPYEHRVASLPRYLMDPRLLEGLGVPRNAAGELAGLEQYISQLYGIEWAQHHFLYYNIQSLDVVQMPRKPQDLEAYDMAFLPRSAADFSRFFARQWQLTNTRYLIGATSFLDFLNQVVDPAQHRFRIAETFQIVPKPGIAKPTKFEEMTAQPATNGPFAVFEFTGALPRVKLYSNWQVQTNDQATLQELVSPAFDPEKKVLAANPVPGAPASNESTNAGRVEFASYAPKDIKLKADAPSPTVLLLNDRYDPNWKVFVDGTSAPLLRCNFIMRGVYLPAGSHTVEFRFEPPVNTLYVSFAATFVGVLLCGILLIPQRRKEPEPDKPADAQGPKEAPQPKANRA